MSELKVKSTVRPRTLVIAAAIINSANELKLEQDMLITSGNDGTHMKGSKHYTDEALDMRSHQLTTENTQAIIRVLRRRLGKDYQVILESVTLPNEHIHIEYDPSVKKI